MILIASTDQDGDFVTAGGAFFPAERNPMLQRAYCEAVDRLVDRGLATQVAENGYQLTAEGFEKAKVMKSKRVANAS